MNHTGIERPHQIKTLESKTNDKGERHSRIMFNGEVFHHYEIPLDQEKKNLLAYFFKEGCQPQGAIFSAHGAWGPEDGMTKLKHTYNFMTYHGKGLKVSDVLSASELTVVDAFSGNNGHFANYRFKPLDMDLASETSKAMLQFIKSGGQNKVGIVLACSEEEYEKKMHLSDLDQKLAPKLSGGGALDMIVCRHFYNMNHVDVNENRELPVETERSSTLFMDNYLSEERDTIYNHRVFESIADKDL